jgi:hypothetical protein
MATIYHWGPYFFSIPGQLPVGSAYNVVWGPDDRFQQCTFNVTGHPYGNRDGFYAAWVTDMSISNTQTHSGDITYTETRAHTTFANDGANPIDGITAYLTVTKA